MDLPKRARRLVNAYRRWRFFRQLKASFAAMTPEERADYDREFALWDAIPIDGLEEEDWSDFETDDAWGKPRVP
jgi:hypothetical protein